jgi:FixJ family two-component response regulator
VAEVSVISIIDDDASVRTATAGLLRSMGFSVYAFASAQEFLSSPRLPETSCVIADVQMPGMSGVELQEYLIAHDHGLPVIFITAFPHERVRERAMKGGAASPISVSSPATRATIRSRPISPGGSEAAERSD